MQFEIWTKALAELPVDCLAVAVHDDGELSSEARALDLRAPLTPSPATAAVVALLRRSGVEGPGPDRHLSPEIETAVGLVQSGAVLAAAESVIGELA